MGPIYLSGSQKTKRATLQETPTRALNQTLHFRQCKISIRGNYFVKQRSDPCLLSAAKQTSCCWQWGPTLKWRQLRQGLERAWKRAHKWHNDENFTDAKYNDGSDMSWNQDSHAGWYKQLSKRAKAASRNRGAVRSWNRGASWA